MENNNSNNNPSLISNLISVYSIVDVVKNYINVTKKGQNYWALCPFHGDKNPSLSISPNKNIFKCFVCDAKGNAISFVMLYKKISFLEAVKEIKTILNINNPDLDKYINSSSNVDKETLEIFDINKRASYFYFRTLFNKDSKECLDYLKDRNVTEDIIKFYEIGYTPKNFERNYIQKIFETFDKENYDPYKLLKAGLVSLNENNNFVDFFNNRLIIPIKDEHGNVAGFSGRTLNKNEKIKYINTKTTKVFKKDNILFNFFAFNKSDVEEIYIVEGYMDVFALRRLGIENAVASMGTSFTQNQINLIKKYPKIKRVILCLDNDFAGSEATISLAEKLIKSGFDIFLVKPYDNKFKDIDELSRSLSKEECLKIINNQVGFIEYLIANLKKLDLSYKEKKIELQNIIKIINDFAYKIEFITEDKKLISEFFEIELSELEKCIIDKSVPKNNYNNNFNRQNNFNNNYNKNNFNQTNKSPSSFKQTSTFEKFEKEINDFTNYEAKKPNHVVKDGIAINKVHSTGLKVKEMDLIISLIYTKELASLYFEYLGFILFNNDNNTLSKLLKVMVYIVKKEYKKNDYNIETIKTKIMETDSLSQTETDYFVCLLKNWENKLKVAHPEYEYENSILPENLIKKIFIKGIYLLKDIKLDQINKVINQKIIQITKSSDSDVVKEIEREIRILKITKQDFLEQINYLLAKHLSQ